MSQQLPNQNAFDILDIHKDRVQNNTKAHYECVKTSLSKFLTYVFEVRELNSIFQVDEAVMSHYYDRLKASYEPRTAHNHWIDVRYYFSTVERETGFPNPCEQAEEEYDEEVRPSDLVGTSAKIQKGGEWVVYIEDEDYKQMLEETDLIRNELLLRLLYDCGLRASELCEVEVEDVEEEENAITSIQTKKRDDGHERTVWYTPATSSIMTEYLHGGGRSRYSTASDSDYLLVSLRSEQMHPNWLNRRVVDIAKDAGVQEVIYKDAQGYNRYAITAHQFRHTYAINRVREDVGKGAMPLNYLAELLGHKDTNTTEWYTRFKQAGLKKAEQRYSP